MLHKVLWTGGFDSTFRLCQLVHNNEEIQPIYIMHPFRPSLDYELEAQHNIMEFLKTVPSKAVIHPTIYVDVQTIPYSEKIHNTIMRVRKKYPIGMQYDWLASYAQTNPYCELCHEGFVRRRGALGNFLEEQGVLSSDSNLNIMLDQKESSEDALLLFGNYYFPLIHLNNLSMIELLYQWNMSEIFSLIRFCDSKYKDACGVCSCCNGKFSVGAKEFQFTPLAKKHHLIATLLKDIVTEQKPNDKKFLSDFYVDYIKNKLVGDFEAKHYQISLPYLTYISGILMSLDKLSDETLTEVFKQVKTFEELCLLAFAETKKNV